MKTKQMRESAKYTLLPPLKSPQASAQNRAEVTKWLLALLPSNLVPWPMIVA